MPWAQVHWRSDILAKQTTMQVLLPSVGRPPYATFYLLHGLSDDSTIWLRRSRIEAYVRELPLIVVMPDGYRGFYTDNEQGPAYTRHFGEELPGVRGAQFPRPARARRPRHRRTVHGRLRRAAARAGLSGEILLGQQPFGRAHAVQPRPESAAGAEGSGLRKHPPEFFAEMRRISAGVRWTPGTTCSRWSGTRGGGTGACPGC